MWTHIHIDSFRGFDVSVSLHPNDSVVKGMDIKNVNCIIGGSGSSGDGCDSDVVRYGLRNFCRLLL